MRTGWDSVGYTRIINTKCLQKNGHGLGGPTYSAFTSATVRSLKKKGLIKIEGIVFVRDNNWVLTDKGRNLKLIDPMQRSGESPT